MNQNEQAMNQNERNFLCINLLQVSKNIPNFACGKNSKS